MLVHGRSPPILSDDIDMGLATNPREHSTAWDLNETFEKLVTDEGRWWRSRGVDRPHEFMLPPHGSLDALVACHMFNPTFCVADPYATAMYDMSNPSMAQINRAGFNTENSLFFDHFARREDSEHVDKFYPKDLCDIYVRFISALRHAMRAVVEVCWGFRVHQRMQTLCNLQQLTLWGEYRDVTLHLEFSNDQKSLKRFLLFVRHPQSYAYVKSTTERAQEFRTRNGRVQDLKLKVASLLGNIEIEPHFYEYGPGLLTKFKETGDRRARREKMRGEARAQLRAVFPEIPLRTESKLSPLATSAADQEELAMIDNFRALWSSNAISTPQTEPDISVNEVQVMKSLL